MQFDGRDNYHQVSEWKTVPREADRLQAARVIQARFHSKRERLLAAEWCAPQFARLEQLGAEHASELQKLDQSKTPAASVIGRIDWKLETMHGKNLCDPLSCLQVERTR